MVKCGTEDEEKFARENEMARNSNYNRRRTPTTPPRISCRSSSPASPMNSEIAKSKTFDYTKAIVGVDKQLLE